MYISVMIAYLRFYIYRLIVKSENLGLVLWLDFIILLWHSLGLPNNHFHTGQWKSTGFATNAKASKLGRTGFNAERRIIDR